MAEHCVLKQLNPKPPSPEFVDAFFGGGGLVTRCACGRLYFGGQGWFDPGEQEDLRAKAKADPERYIERDEDYVPTAVVCGMEFVTDCPCHGLRAYEEFILGHRHQIARFLGAASVAMAQDAHRFGQAAREASRAEAAMKKARDRVARWE